MGNQELLAIDIGTDVIKVLSGSIDINGVLSITGNGVVPTEGFSKGTITSSDALTKSLQLAVECVTTNNDTTQAYLGVGGMGLESHTAVGHIPLNSLEIITACDLDRVCRAAVLTAVPDELEVLHVLPKSFHVDGQVFVTPPIGQNGKQLEAEVLIVTVPKSLINGFVRDLKAVGLEITGVVANAVVLGQVLAKDLKTRSSLILDIGAGTTDIVVYDDGQIIKVFSLPFGGAYITSDIMQGIGIDYNHAEAIKRYYAKLDKNLHGNEVILDCNDNGTTDKNIPYDFLFNIIESRVEEIVLLVFEALKPILDEVKIEKIHITGGCSAMNSFIECLEKIGGLPVIQVVPSTLPAEYSNPVNTACYGIMCYAKSRQKSVETISTGTWNFLLTKVKHFFKPTHLSNSSE
ncbi:cell division protein FtsA [bacterium BFN5]|nr:cell division protein FtsA [bacterium BFN5]QJW46507.1 cell division protein FtsA [bacterium BFN5]